MEWNSLNSVKIAERRTLLIYLFVRLVEQKIQRANEKTASNGSFGRIKMIEEMKEKIQQLAGQIYPEVFQHYTHLHAHPELSYQEYETSAYVQSVLTALGVEFRAGIANTGILGIIKGMNPKKKTMALRADMDALPIQEENDVPFKSRKNSVMHACGHDAHTASLLGVAQLLTQTKEDWEGTVLLIFQPGEEKHPGGARLMLEEHVFGEYVPELIVAQHAFAGYETGHAGFRSGIIMAAADEIHIKIKGRGGHGALPHLLDDTVLAASQCVVAMQHIVSRRANPFSPVVLSFGKLIAAGDTNVIPNEVTLAGTLRTMDETERMRLKELIRNTAIHTAQACGCQCDMVIHDGYPCVINDPEVTRQAAAYAQEYLGAAKVHELEPRMTSEDFAFFSQQYPATFYRFGVQGKETCGSLHSSLFLIDPASLKTSVGLMTYLALRFLGQSA